MEAAAVRSAAAQLQTLLSETQAQQVILATSYDAWEDRLNGMKSPEDLIAALKDLEQELNGLGDGLPRGERLGQACMKLCECQCAVRRINWKDRTSSCTTTTAAQSCQDGLQLMPAS